MSLALNDVVTRLKTGNVFKFVGGSADIPAANVMLKTFPALFVIPLADSAAPNSLAGQALSQKVTERFGVVSAVRNVADATGEHALNDLQGVRTQIKSKLLGWVPNAECEQVTYLGGNLVKLDNDAVLWWLDTFETSYLERVV